MELNHAPDTSPDTNSVADSYPDPDAHRDTADAPVMLDVAYWVAAVLGFAGALAGNRVAWPLLGSFAFYQVACWQEWEYDPVLWATIDCAVLIFIAVVLFNEARKNRLWTPSWRDIAVVLLFAPLVGSYALEPGLRHIASMVVSIAQLLVVFPPGHAWRALTQASDDHARKDDFDMMVRA